MRKEGEYVGASRGRPTFVWRMRLIGEPPPGVGDRRYATGGGHGGTSLQMDRRGSGHGVGAPGFGYSTFSSISPTGDRGSRLVTSAIAFVSCCL